MKHYLIFLILLLPIAVGAQIDNTIDKGAGILYFNGIPGISPDTTSGSYESEVGFNMITGELWGYNRDSMSWKRIFGVTKGYGNPSGNPDIYAKSYINLTDGSFWRWNGLTWVNAFASGGGGGGDSTIFQTIYRDDTSKVAIRSEIPTLTSQLTNDSGFLISESQSLSISGTEISLSGGGGSVDVGTINSVNGLEWAFIKPISFQSTTISLKNQTLEKLKIDSDGVKFMNSNVNNTGDTLLVLGTNGEVEKRTDLTGFLGAGGTGGANLSNTNLAQNALRRTYSMSLGQNLIFQAPQNASERGLIGIGDFSNNAYPVATLHMRQDGTNFQMDSLRMPPGTDNLLIQGDSSFTEYPGLYLFSPNGSCGHIVAGNPTDYWQGEVSFDWGTAGQGEEFHIRIGDTPTDGIKPTRLRILSSTGHVGIGMPKDSTITHQLHVFDPSGGNDPVRYEGLKEDLTFNTVQYVDDDGVVRTQPAAYANSLEAVAAVAKNVSIDFGRNRAAIKNIDCTGLDTVYLDFTNAFDGGRYSVRLHDGDSTIVVPDTTHKRLSGATLETGLVDGTRMYDFLYDNTLGNYLNIAIYDDTTTATAPPPPTLVFGCADFDGNDQVDVPNSGTDFTFGTSTNFTIEAWVKPDATASYQTIFSSGYSSQGNGGFAFYLSPGGDLEFWESGQLIGSTTATISAGVWTHVSVTRSGSTFYASVGGTVETINASLSQTLGGTSYNTYVGRTESSAFWNGNMTGVRVSKGIARYISNFTPTNNYGSDVNTVLLYIFDETTGTVVGDSSSSGNTGTLVGATDLFWTNCTATP